MARWQFSADSASSDEYELTDATARKVTWRLRSNAEASFSIDGTTPHAGDIDELVSDLFVRLDGVLVYRGRITAAQDTVDSETHPVSVSSVDYRKMLSRRILYSDAPLVHAAVDQSDIAWQLVDYTQSLTNGDLGITQGFGAVTGVERTIDYEPGKFIGNAIDELSTVDGGFDWDVDADLALNVYYPRRDRDLHVVLDYGGLVRRVQTTSDPEHFANAARFSGDGVTVAAELEAPGLPTDPRGRWDAQIGQTDASTQSFVDDRAAQELESRGALQRTYQVTLRRDGWRGPGHIWLGDTVRLVARSLPRVDVDESVRVHEISAAIDENGEADVTMSLAGPAPRFESRIPDLAQRVTNLERR